MYTYDIKYKTLLSKTSYSLTTEFPHDKFHFNDHITVMSILQSYIRTQ